MTNQEILKKHIPEHQIWGNGITGKPFLQNTLLENVLSALEEAREDERNIINQGRGEGPVCKTGEWQLCPKCNGQGIVSKPFYVAGDVYQWTGTAINFPCDVCNGAKIIARPIEWLKEPDQLEQSKKEQ